MSIREKLDRAQEICGHQFNDISLLRSAVTHPSAVEGEPVSASYERLEFLGDSILGAVVAVSLFQTYTDFDEGKLTRLKVSLVSGATLSDVGLELGIDKVIILGASEQGTGARGMHSALENVYEALVGALYLDCLLYTSCSVSEDISRLKYVSGAREEALRRLGIERVGDLLLHIPFRYLDFTHALSIEMAPIGEVSTIVGTVDSVANRPTSKRGMIVTEVFLVDASGVLKIAFFKQPWIAREFAVGDRVAVIGKVEFAYGFKQMTSPQYERIEDGGAQGAILPVHRVCDGVSQAWMRRLTSVALERVGVFCDPVPVGLRARRRLMSLSRAVRCAHFPRIVPEVDLARRRFSYDELLYLQLALRLRNDTNLLGCLLYTS